MFDGLVVDGLMVDAWYRMFDALMADMFVRS